MAVDPYFQKKVPDITIVPIRYSFLSDSSFAHWILSISYEKVLEAESYANELLGEQVIS